MVTTPCFEALTAQKVFACTIFKELITVLIFPHYLNPRQNFIF